MFADYIYDFLSSAWPIWWYFLCDVEHTYCQFDIIRPKVCAVRLCGIGIGWVQDIPHGITYRRRGGTVAVGKLHPHNYFQYRCSSLGSQYSMVLLLLIHVTTAIVE